MLPTSEGWNPRPPGLQSDGVSNWATEANRTFLGIEYSENHFFLKLNICFVGGWTRTPLNVEFLFKITLNVILYLEMLKYKYLTWTFVYPVSINVTNQIVWFDIKRVRVK